MSMSKETRLISCIMFCYIIDILLYILSFSIYSVRQVFDASL